MVIYMYFVHWLSNRINNASFLLPNRRPSVHKKLLTNGWNAMSLNVLICFHMYFNCRLMSIVLIAAVMCSVFLLHCRESIHVNALFQSTKTSMRRSSCRQTRRTALFNIVLLLKSNNRTIAMILVDYRH
jgi:hypothetical protein